MIVIGVDIGGTFTDFVTYDDASGEIKTLKLLSTPKDPSKAVIEGLNWISRQSSGKQNELTLIHGSTVATNALLERKGANTALITTSGFKDILYIGRQNRAELYDLLIEIPKPLIPANQLYEVVERVDAEGNVLIPLDTQSLTSIIDSLKTNNIEAVAVCLLFSFLYPNHERIIADELAEFKFNISLSSEILPEFREYERTSTTVVNAYVSPILNRYLEKLGNSLKDYHLRVMQSNGGMISLGEARRFGIRCILSGPAGGIIGAEFLSKIAHSGSNHNGNSQDIKLITFDMGGTSTDVSLIDTIPTLTSESVVDGYPIRIPMLDIHTIGAGGGSIAYIDPGGALRVGPRSAGADPGPACYGKGYLPTVTDAHVVLGRIIPELFLGGTMPLDNPRSEKAISSLSSEIGAKNQEVALGIIEIVNTHMTRALRLISVERGYDPREFTLISFGGAGGLHACDLARTVGIRKVVISPYASTFSALGMLAADIVKDYVQTVMLPGDIPGKEIERFFKPLVNKAIKEIRNEGISSDDINIYKSLDMRYEGQSYELNIKYLDDYLRLFENTHNEKYGYVNQNSSIEIVNVRVRAVGKTKKPKLSPFQGFEGEPTGAFIGYKDIYFRNGIIKTPVYQGETLKFGNILNGPALIARSDTTILLNQGDKCEIDNYHNLNIYIASD